MNRLLILWTVAGIGATVWLVSSAAAQKPQTTPTEAPAADATSQQEADAALRAAAKEFTAAFDRGDAEALAQHFATDGIYIDEDGQRFAGRKSIQREYATLFANRSDLRLQLEIDKIRLLNATTAIEEGRVALSPQPPGSIRVMSRYTAVHTRQDGKWLLADVRDTRVELPPDYGQLEDLGWLVGTWAAVDDSKRVEIKGRWVEGNHYLARWHRVTESGKVTSTGLEMIGLDPSTGQITSWNFTSDGGHAVGRWAPHDNGWVVQSVGVMKDGTQTIATYILSRKDKDTLVWKSGNRFAGNTALPDNQEVALEHFILMELAAHRSLSELDYEINFWRTKTGLEVDFVLGGGEIAIEVKGTSRVDPKHLRGISTFTHEFSPKKAIVVCAEQQERVLGAIRIMPWMTFLEKLWDGSMIQ